MAEKDVVMRIEKSHFIVKLHKTLLEVDLKEGAKKELESFLESKPKLRDSLGLLFQTIVPLDVRLRDIKSVGLDKKGRVKVTIPSRKDIVIPLDEDESKRLIQKMNELIPVEKERLLRQTQEAKRLKKEAALRRALDEKDVSRTQETSRII